MLLDYKLGQTSIVLRVKLRNSSVSTGAGLTGLTNASTGLVISTIADNEATATAYTAAGSTIDTIATLGTFATPTASHCRFKEVDATNHKGIYEIQIDNARFAVANSKSLLISLSGATNLAECDVIVPLRSIDPYNGTTGGLGNLDAAVSTRSTYAGADTAGTTTLLGRLTSGRATNLDNLDAAVSTRSTYAGGDTSGTTTLLTRIPGTVQPQTGDSYARLGAPIGASISADVQTRSTYAGADTSGTTTLLGRLTSGRATNLDNLDATVSSRLATSGYTAPPTAAAVATAVLTDTTDTGTVGSLGYLIGHAPGWYTAPDNSDVISVLASVGSGLGTAVLAVKAQTDKLTFSGSNLFAVVEAYAAGQDPATLVLDATASGHNTAGSIGNKINAAGSAGDPWATTEPGAYASGTFGYFVTHTLAQQTGAVVTLDLAQPLVDVKTGTVGGALNGAWSTAWGKLILDRVGKVLKLFSWNSQTVPLETFNLDDGTAPTTRTPT